MTYQRTIYNAVNHRIVHTRQTDDGRLLHAATYDVVFGFTSRLLTLHLVLRHRVATTTFVTRTMGGELYAGHFGGNFRGD